MSTIVSSPPSASAMSPSSLQHAGQRSTILDVARSAGVSKSTVSNYMNGKGRMGSATRERIRLAMQALHFAPNAHTRALREGCSRIIGILPSTKSITSDPATALLELSFLQGISEAASETGFNLLFFTGDRNRYSEQDFLSGQIDGLLYMAGSTDSELPRVLTEAGLPTLGVFVDGAATADSTPSDLTFAHSRHHPTVARDAGYSAVQCLLASMKRTQTPY